MSDENYYYVYGLIRPDNMSLFYIGMTCKEERIQQHIDWRKNKNTYKNNIISYCIDKLGFKSIPYIIFGNKLSFQEAADLETSLIEKIGRLPIGPLTNICVGGESPFAGKPAEEFSEIMKRVLADPEVRAKMSAKAKARDRTGEWEQKRKEAARTPEVRAKMSAAKKNKPSQFKGRKHSEESIAKAKISHSGKIWIHNGTESKKIFATEQIPSGWQRGRGSLSASHRLALKKAHTGKKLSEEHKSNIGKAHKGQKRSTCEICKMG